MLKAALYIHFPWCIKKCPYCDFNSHQSPSLIPEQEYIDALIADLDEDLSQYPKRTISSIFLGGGTPSLFSPEAIEKLFLKIKERLSFEKSIEITMEANPSTVEAQRFKEFQRLGINRLSLGIQSFNDHHLKALGRVHNSNDARKAIEIAQSSGFESINLDLMHSLPKQTVSEALLDLKEALRYEPQHLSWYQLTIEANTVFYKKPPILPKEEITEQIEIQGMRLLEEKSYHHYEISAFAKPNFESKHNLNYWLFGDYLGIGAGAHGKMTNHEFKQYRSQKNRQPGDYLNPSKPFLVSASIIEESSLIFEFMLNTTRLNRPLPFQLFTEKTGLPIDCIQETLEKAANLGLIHLSLDSMQITTFGRRFTNELQSLFLP